MEEVSVKMVVQEKKKQRLYAQCLKTKKAYQQVNLRTNCYDIFMFLYSIKHDIEQYIIQYEQQLKTPQTKRKP